MKIAAIFLIEDSSQIGEVRRYVSSWITDVGIDEVRGEEIRIVINELGTNILKHAKKGELLCVLTDEDINIMSIDRGPGLSNARSFEDGFSTQGTAGNGLGAVKRLADFVDYHSTPNKGLIILAVFEYKKPKNSSYLIRGFALPIKGETVSGDNWISEENENGMKVMVADGLGHGLSAHTASSEAVEAFLESKKTSILEDITLIHGRLRSTRGAAIAVAYLDHQSKMLDYGGLGNISGSIVNTVGMKKLISFNGTAGVQLRKVNVLSYPLERDSIIVFASDGLGTQWDLDDYVGIKMRHPLVIAGLLFRDFTRGTDDVSVVVVKERE